MLYEDWQAGTIPLCPSRLIDRYINRQDGAFKGYAKEGLT